MIIKAGLKIVIVVFFSFLFVLFSSSAALADNCPMYQTTISSNCSFQQSDENDVGILVLDSQLEITNGATLSLLNGQTLYVPKIKVTNGIITSVGTTKIDFNQGAIPKWMLDKDNDGWPATTEIRSQATAPTTDWKRLATIVSRSTVDCYDSNALAKPDFGTTPTPILRTAHRGDGSFDYNCNGGSVGTDLQYTENAQYVCSTTGCAAHYYSNVSGWVGSSGYPACGASKDYNTAQGAGINETCTASNCNIATATRTQGCR